MRVEQATPMFQRLTPPPLTLALSRKGRGNYAPHGKSRIGRLRFYQAPRRSSVVRVRASESSITGIPSRTGNATASFLQISSDLSLSYWRGPLHSGHTKRDSNRLSMVIAHFLNLVEFFLHLIIKPGIQHGFHTQGVHIFRRELPALYRILVSHHDR